MKTHLLLTALALLAACDTIENPVPAKVTSTLTAAEQTALDAAETQLPAPPDEQRVLIEDYTGQYCGNCPRAAHLGDSLQRAHPTRVFTTEVHVTDYFAAPRPPHFPIDFRVLAVAQELDRLFDLSTRGLPQGAVNRTPFAAANNDPVATFALWPQVVAAQLALTPAVALRVTPVFNAGTRVLNLKIGTEYRRALPGRNLRLGIVLVEDSLVGAQKDYRLNRTQFPDQTAEQYVHHNVLRAALAGTFGTAQATGPAAGQRFANYLGYQMPAATVWNARKCAVLAYIADADTRQILQVTMAGL